MDYDAIDEFKSKLGYFALISTDMSLSAEEALTIYREKDVVEKAFDQLKNGMDYRRMRTHYAQTTEGKTFVVFISLIVRSVMIKKLKGNEETSDLTIKQAIKQLENILELHSEGKRNLLTISKMQRNILAAIGVEQFKK
jgi:transposase